MPVHIDSDDDWLTSTGMHAWFGKAEMRATFLGASAGASPCNNPDRLAPA